MPSGIWHFTEPEKYAALREVTEKTYLEPGRGLPGRIWESGAPVWIPDINADPNIPRARPRNIGVRAAFGFPIKVHERVIAILEFFSDIPTQPDPDLMITLRTIGDQVGRVFERRQAEEALRKQAEALEQAYQESQTQVAELQKAEEHQRLLMAELNHRVKNMLAVVTGIASQTARSSRSIAAFNENFMARLGALARAHTLLTERNWAPTPLQRLMEELVGPYAQPEEGHLEVSGPPVSLPPKASLAVSMILHELITNAAKYGALSVPDGRIFVHWSVSSEADRLIRLTWRETGMQGLSRPRKTGFGTRMIEASVQHELGGRVAITYRPEGIHYDFEFSANQ
jgi:two-component sensor histidine kinase